MDNMLKEYIEKLKLVDTVEEYEEFISKLHQMMKQETYKNDIVQNIRNKQKYMVNKYIQEQVGTVFSDKIANAFLLSLS